MEIRKAGVQDVELLTENRMEFLNSLGPVENAAALRPAVRRYLQEHLGGDALIYYICLDEGRVVSSCCLCITQTLPTTSVPNGKQGLLLNVYTAKEYRRRGLARTLTARLIEEARSLQVGKITLDFTDEGYPLYLSMGFHKNERNMELKL